MPIESDKPLKKCKFCNKEVANLGLHIINIHPSIMEQIEETTPQNVASLPQNSTLQNNTRQSSDINSMIREKLDTMLNIKIIEMLSSSKDVSLIDIKKSLETPQNTTLQDIKTYHDMIYADRKESPEINISGDSGGWLELANNAIPLIREMLPKSKQEEKKNDAEHTRTKEGSIGIRRLIPQEIAGNTGESKSTSGQPSVIVRTEQQNNNVDADVNKRT